MSRARVRFASVHLFCVVSPRAEPQGPRRWGHRQPGAREEQLDSGSVVSSPYSLPCQGAGHGTALGSRRLFCRKWR